MTNLKISNLKKGKVTILEKLTEQQEHLKKNNDSSDRKTYKLLEKHLDKFKSLQIEVETGCKQIQQTKKKTIDIQIVDKQENDVKKDTNKKQTINKENNNEINSEKDILGQETTKTNKTSKPTLSSLLTTCEPEKVNGDSENDEELVTDIVEKEHPNEKRSVKKENKDLNKASKEIPSNERKLQGRV